MTSARIAGLIFAILFAVVFIVVVTGSLRSDRPVVPTNGVTAGGAKDNPAGAGALAELQARTKMQQWPGQTAQPAPSGRTLALGAPGPSASGEQRVGEWLADKGANRNILQDPRFLSGTATLPSEERAVLMQPQGRTWRDFHNDQLAWGGGIYVFGVSFLIALFLTWRGRIPIEEGESAETVQRFSALERANHWLTAGSFLLMALTGLIILYGNGLIRPWLGAGPYARLAEVSAWSHMTFAVPFVLGVLVMIALWTRQNLFERLDWEWLKRGGGFVSEHTPKPPARKFNAGQKLVFWGVVLGALALTATGVGLMFPFYWTGYTGMQVTQVLHAGFGLLMVGLIIGHIYIGTIGMVGAFDAMWSGRVDRNWAREHHSLWSEQAAAEAEPRTSARSPGRAIATFAAGLVVAVALAVGMVAVYRNFEVSTNQRAASPSVHLTGVGASRQP